MLVNDATIICVSVLLLTFMALGIKLLLAGSKRQESDVYESLLQDGCHVEESSVPPEALRTLAGTLADEAAQVGIFEPVRKRNYLVRRNLIPLYFAACGAAVFLIARPGQAFAALAAIAGSGLLGVAARGKFHESRRARYQRSVEFHLPLVMERIVMAVQAGHDITSAVRTVLELEKERGSQSGAQADSPDPVSALLEIVYQLTSGGLTFEESLRLVAGHIRSVSVKHAFIHLALAHRQGGGIILPLKELADASQLYYQESVEEDIAKLPAKATGPLALCFVGVLCSFLATPLVSVVSMLGKVTAGQPHAVVMERR